MAARIKGIQCSQSLDPDPVDHLALGPDTRDEFPCFREPLGAKPNEVAWRQCHIPIVSAWRTPWRDRRQELDDIRGVHAAAVLRTDQARNRLMDSTMQAGLSAPSISTVTVMTAWTPPGTSVTSVTTPVPRTREPTTTGDGNRTLLTP